MDTPISLQELLKFIMYLLGIGVLAYLLIILKNAADIIKNVQKLSDENYDNINEAVASTSNIIKSVDSITNTLDETLENISPEVDGIVHSANNITSRVESVSDLMDNAAHKISGTVDNVTGNINDTADRLNESVNNITFYLSIINEIVGIIGNIIFKK